jgi:MFS family permease
MIAEILNESPLELTTSATDAVLAIECIVIIIYLRRIVADDRWRLTLWCWVFGLMGCASALGAVSHGFILSGSVQATLWRPLFLSLGILVALFMVGALYDGRGRALAARFIPWAIGIGSAFFVFIEVFSGEFFAFVVYEMIAMSGAVAIYLYLGVAGRLRGAFMIAIAIVLNLVAAGVQASDVSFHFLFPFDHNGVFHLIQMVAIFILAVGLAPGMRFRQSDGGA